MVLDRQQMQEHRDLVIQLSKPGGALSSSASTATVRNPEWFLSRTDGALPILRASRARLHKSLMDQYRANSSGALKERKAIVMAGPPGAGKGYVQGVLLGDSKKDYLTLDADEFKRALLEQAIQDGSYESWLKEYE